MGKFTADKAFENPKKVWIIPVVDIISDGDIETGVTVNFIEGNGPTPGKGTDLFS